MKQVRSFFSVLLLGISLMTVSAPSFSADWQKGMDAYNRGDYQAALREWRPLAKQGDADTQFVLGSMYLQGRGVAQSFTKAVKWFRKAAEQGQVGAQWSLGLIYREGRGVPQDYKTAVKWFRLAAEQGNAEAQYSLGSMYRKGRGVAQSDTEAVKWLRLAAEQGGADAQYFLGFMYLEGRGVAQSDTKAVKWFRKASQQGDSFAQAALGAMYIKGRGVAQSDTEAVKWLRLAAEQGNTKAVEWLRLVAEQGNELAQKELRVIGVDSTKPQIAKAEPKTAQPSNQTDAGARAYNRGDYQAALRELRPLAEQGNADAQIFLGVIYREGRGVPQDYKTAVKWFRLAAEQGDSFAQFFHGSMYLEGRGVPQDYKTAVKWFRLAAEQGDSFAQAALGTMYIKGRGVAQSDTEAEKWFRKSAEQGNENAQNRLKEMGIDWTKPQIAKAEPKMVEPTDQTNADESERVKELEKRLALLEAQTKQSEQAIASDNTPPMIRITSSTTEGLQARISAQVTDNVSVGEVTLNGSPPLQINGSTYYWETFIPSDGLTVLIEAVDQRGLMSRKSTRIERQKTTETVTRLAALNPLVGPKQKLSRDRAALIIGIEKYAAALPADFASRDAQMFADYAMEKLGVPAGNIKILTDEEATRGGLLSALKRWLPQTVQPNQTDLYVFYSGHGMALDDDAYIVPYGADTFLPEDTAISRERFFAEISASKPRTATFFFDNCYSGTTRSEERLLAQKPLTIKLLEPEIPENYLIFTAGESNQTAGVLNDMQYGRFSYFLFKGLEGEADSNSDGKISAGELHAYVKQSVGRFSAGAQTPTMLGDAGRWVLR